MFSFVQSRGGNGNRVAKKLLNKMLLFQGRPDLVAAGKYTIKCAVEPDVVDLFFARVMGDDTEVVTAQNAKQLRALCDELGFAGFDDELRPFLSGNGKARKDFLSLRGRVDRHDVVIEELQRRVLELERQLRAQRGLPEKVEAVERRVEEIRRNDVAEAIAEARSETGGLRKDVEQLKREVSGRELPEDVRRALAEGVVRLKGSEGKCVKTPHVPGRTGKAPTQVGREFVYNEARPLDGIIAHLTRQCGGNVHKEGVVNVTASSCWGDSYKPENAVDLKSDSGFYSSNSPTPSWICYDFKGRRVTPTSYSIRSKDGGPGYCNPKSWVLEVSNDGSEGSWAVIDSRENNNDLNDCHVTRNFSLGTPQSGAFRFVRLRLTGKSHYGDDSLNICALELFGTLSPE